MSYGEVANGVIAFSGSTDLTIDAASVIATPSLGSIGFNQTLSRALTNILGTGSVGSLVNSATVSVTITSPTITGSRGTIGTNQTLSRALIGLVGTTSVASVTNSQSLSRSLTTVFSSVATNSITFSTTSTRSITGSSVNTNIGNLVNSQVLTRGLTGNLITSALHPISFNQTLNRVLAGVEGRLVSGYEVPTAAVSILLKQNTAQILVGNIATNSQVIYQINGVLSVGFVKTISTNNEVKAIKTDYKFVSIPYSITNYSVVINTKESGLTLTNKYNRVIVSNK